MTRAVNAAGLALVKAQEGLRLEAYQDGGGVWTIGYGHTHGVKRGDAICTTRAEMLLAADIADAACAVGDLVRVPLNDNQFAALVDFVFNEGAGAFAGSTLLRKLNEGGYGLVPACLKAWIFVDGRVAPGLVRRRAAEAMLWGER